MIAGEAGFAELCEQLKGWCGVTLTPSKTYLVQNRLRGLMQELHVTDLRHLLQQAKGAVGAAIRDRIVDALTTHETLFFRDALPFQALATHVLPEFESGSTIGRKRLRIWSAACSTGQEPYSIAMTLLNAIRDPSSWDIRILATDVSPASIERAKEGVYQEHEVKRGIDSSQLTRFFQPASGGWRINDEVRKYVQFEVGNLIAGVQPDGPFDIIFCRNVVIYFSGNDPQKIFTMLSKRLSSRGRLFVGCSEVLTNFSRILTRERIGPATCYRPANVLQAN